jgi:predicted RNase H-like HicB family nuclease
MLTYTVILTPERDGSAVTVTVPALPNVLTWGKTYDEALASAREAITLHLESYVERSRPFPQNRQPPKHRADSLRQAGRVEDVTVSIPALGEAAVRRTA